MVVDKVRQGQRMFGRKKAKNGERNMEEKVGELVGSLVVRVKRFSTSSQEIR